MGFTLMLALSGCFEKTDCFAVCDVDGDLQVAMDCPYAECETRSDCDDSNSYVHTRNIDGQLTCANYGENPDGTIIDESPVEDTGFEVVDTGDSGGDTADTGEDCPYTWYYHDGDGDGYGDPNGTSLCLADRPDGYVDNPDDCDDDDGDIGHASTLFYTDNDGDGYGTFDSWVTACEMPDGYSENADDCDDENPLIHPDAVEVCDEVDNDCNGQADDDALDADQFFTDADGDGDGDIDNPWYSCELAPEGYSENADDCDDTDAAVNLDALEVCDEVDNDCDGDIDDDDSSVDGSTGNTYYEDADGDTKGNPDVSTMTCSRQDGWRSNKQDCDDTDPNVYTGAAEVTGDEVDQDCDGTEICYVDADKDGYSDGSTVTSSDLDCDDTGEGDDSVLMDDCDDFNNTVNPGATETCDDSVDNNCDGNVDEEC